MIETLKKFGAKKLGGLILIAVIIIAFGFGGFGGGFSTNNQNNIAKINKTNVTTQDFMNYVNESGISQQAIRENLENNIIEELLSGLISTTLIDLEVEDFDLSITELTVLKKIKDNKNFQDDNNVFQRTKYEKFLLSNNMSAPMFELQLKNRELQKHLFDFIGAGTITPNFLIEKKYEENKNSKIIEGTSHSRKANVPDNYALFQVNNIETKYYNYIEKIIFDISNQYAINELRLPFIEKSELFMKSIGDYTDIVNKEMYNFIDKNGESICLRPEGKVRVLMFNGYIKKELF